MFRFAGQERISYSVNPLIQSNDERGFRHIQIGTKPFFSVFDSVNPDLLYNNVREAFPLGIFNTPCGYSNQPALWKYTVPTRFAVNSLTISRERDYRVYAHTPCMSLELIDLLGYVDRSRIFFDTADEAEMYIREQHSYIFIQDHIMKSHKM